MSKPTTKKADQDLPLSETLAAALAAIPETQHLANQPDPDKPIDTAGLKERLAGLDVLEKRLEEAAAAVDEKHGHLTQAAERESRPGDGFGHVHSEAAGAIEQLAAIVAGHAGDWRTDPAQAKAPEAKQRAIATAIGRQTQSLAKAAASLRAEIKQHRTALKARI